MQAFCFMLPSHFLYQNSHHRDGKERYSSCIKDLISNQCLWLKLSLSQSFLGRKLHWIRPTSHLRQNKENRKEKGKWGDFCSRTKATHGLFWFLSPHVSTADGICWTQSDVSRQLIWFIPNGSPIGNSWNLSYFCFPRPVSLVRSPAFLSSVRNTTCICSPNPWWLWGILVK